MALLLDVFGFLSVVLRGLVLTAQSLAIGGVAFLVLLAHPLRTQLGASGAAVFERCRRLLLWSAIAFAALELVFVLLECLVLAGTVDISLAAAFGADFARFGMTAAAASVLAAALARRPLEGLRFAALPVLALVMLLAQAATSHAAAQLNGRAPLMLADLLHMAAAAAWIGGIPYLLLALGRAGDGAAQARIGRRFSLIALGAVAVLIAAGLGMAVPYIGSLDAIYGTAYGVMVATKVLLLLGLLLLGGMNYLLAERVRRAPGTPVLRLKRFAEVEIGLGFTVLFAAASLTSQPPAVDLTTDRASLHEIAQRLTPHWPRFESPDHARLALSELQAQLDAAAAANAPRPSPGRNTTTIGRASSCSPSACSRSPSAPATRPGRGIGRCSSSASPPSSSSAPTPRSGRSAISASSSASATPRWCSTASSSHSSPPSRCSNGACAPAACAARARRSSFR